MIKKPFFLVMIALSSFHTDAALLLKGNSQASGETFAFPIQQYQASDSATLMGANLYVAAHPDSGGMEQVKEFSVSRITRDTHQFVGLSPKEAFVNNNKQSKNLSANPLYDAGISFLALFNSEAVTDGTILAGSAERPVVVTSADKQTIYFINSFANDGSSVEVISARKDNLLSHNVPDATGAITAGIVGLEAAAPYVFAAVRPEVGSFGQSGSGIALTMIGAVEGEINGVKGMVTAPFIIDAPTGAIARAGGNRASLLDISSSFIKINNDVASIGSIIDMYWFAQVGRLYIALQTTNNTLASDGARALVVGRVTNKNVLELNEIAPANVFDGAMNKIIGSVGADGVTTIHKVRGMFTSTSLPYLIVQGNVGSAEATRRSVFALPVVSGATDATENGMIANKNADPVNIYSAGSIPLFNTRVIKNKVETADQMPLSSDSATQVGHGDLPDGQIMDLFVYEDTVFVTVQTSDNNESPGAFYSQAIFEANGKIQNWTQWRRATGILDKMQSIVLDPSTGKINALIANGANEVKTVKRSEWVIGEEDRAALEPVITSIESFFLPQQGGVQGLFDFIVTATTAGTQTPGLFDISALIATGLGKIMLVQTSSVQNGGIIPFAGNLFGHMTNFKNGEIAETLPIANSSIITIEGGVLDEIGAINAAEIARDGDGGANGYLFIGGAFGLAVLSNVDGSGWDATAALTEGFGGLVNGMSFKKVGDYSEVQKLINDGRYLYVLTTHRLDRIDLLQANVGLGSIIPTVIATSNSIASLGGGTSFLDMLISDQLIVLATNAGLLRIGNGLDVRTASSDTISWQRIDVPETIGPITQLLAITQTGRSQDFARMDGGSYFFALSALRGKNQAQVARYAVRSITSTGVISSTITRIDDLFVKNVPSYFVNFGSFRNGFATDGSLYFGTHSKQLADVNAVVTILYAIGGIGTGSRFLGNKEVPADLNNSSLIAAMLQNSATGSWLIASDQGVRSNE